MSIGVHGNKLVFDIETIGVDFDTLDPISQKALTKYATTKEETEEVKNELVFSPLTGEIVAIGILNPDTSKGAIYMRADADLPAEVELGVAIERGGEKEILQKFWDAATHYTRFVSFNGRGFDVPYLLVRSAIHDVKPTKNLMANRYLNLQPENAKHIDLFEQLTFYGAFRRRGLSLHLWCRAFGIKSPKEVGDGNNVKPLYLEKKFMDIARYNLGDLRATAALYEKWEKYLRF